MLKKFFIILLLPFLLSTAVYSQVSEDWYVGKPIKNFSFKGLRSVQSSEIFGLILQYQGENFTDKLYTEILEKLYALDYFEDITPKAIPADEDYTSIRFEFEFVEKPFVKHIKFIGNEKIRSSSLLEKCLLKKNDIFNENKRRSDEQALRNFYLEKGYDNAEVSCKTEHNEKENYVTIEYTIKEGKQTVVSKILFEGNTRLSDRALKKVLASKEAGLIQSGAFQEAFLEEDKNLLKFYYGEKGYVDARVENIKREIDPESNEQKSKLILTYVIYEGEEFTYSGVTFSGNRIFSSEDLKSKIKLKEGDIFNLKRFELGYNAIADMYFENGYSSTRIERKENKDTAQKTVSYEIAILESKRSHVEKITLKGNTKTKDYVILRELLLESGDVFSKKKFLNSLRNLYNLRYFSGIVPDVQQGSEEGLLDLIFNVEETSTANLQFGITFTGASDSNTFPMSIFAQWEERNLLGTGSALSANLTAGADKQSATIGYTENWFLGSPLSVGFEFSAAHKREYAYQDVLFPIFSDEYGKSNLVPPDPFSTWEEYTENSGLAEAYKMRYDRAEFGFGINSSYKWFPLFSVITLYGGVNFNLVKNYYDTGLYRPVDYGIRRQQKRWGLSNSLWLRLSLDDRDFAHDPSTGWFLSQQFSFFGLIPKVESEYFFRSETKAEAYIKLLDYPVSEVWNLKFVLAFYSGFSFQLPMPNSNITELNKLTIDGMFNGRGWTALGAYGRGNFMQNNWIEFRMPLAHGILSFDFFFDAIAVKHEVKDIKSLNINDYFFSFGPGLRFTLPQFPLRLMFANTFRSNKGKPYWGNGRGADWRFVLSFNIPNL